MTSAKHSSAITSFAATQAIKDVFITYERALNTSDLSLAMSLYTEDAVFMMPRQAPSVGKAAIQVAYDKLFSEVDHHVHVDIDEIKLASGGDLAFARTTTTGTCTIRAMGREVPDAVQQLWVLEFVSNKESERGEWRIARYSFSPTGPDP